MDFGDEPEGSDSQRRRKRYHRHTPRQIQQLEAYAFSLFFFLLLFFYVLLAFVRHGGGAMDGGMKWCVCLFPVLCRMFKECPHPDENQRAQLSRELGLEPRQIKFWFQNRRTQMKVNYKENSDWFS
jgi:homeobox-leucine zipper protein